MNYLNIEPQEVFDWFYRLCQIPHESGDEEAISRFLQQFGEERGLDSYRDKYNNVYIKKPATPGYEYMPAVMLQGHMDMVCVKTADSTHDFTQDPIRPYVDGNFVRARDTSLGADNGIAVAMCLALLDSQGEIPHPELECVFTTDEERGMTGAANIEAERLKSRIFINIDSEEEGEFYVSCAGGVRAVYQLPLIYTDIPVSYMAYTCIISGLQGGHSGMKINAGRANANVLMGQFLNRLTQAFDCYISGMKGGTQDNAIPSTAEFTVCIEEEQVGEMEGCIQEYTQILHMQYEQSGEKLTISVNKGEAPNAVFTKETTKNIIASLLLQPNGVQHMVFQMPLVETSNNIGMVSVKEGMLEITSALRSSVESRKAEMLDKINSVAELTGAVVSIKGDYPAWPYAEGKICRLMCDEYNKLPDKIKDSSVHAIHAGLECGWFARYLEGCDLVSMGPNVFDVHSVDEKLQIDSTQRTWMLLKNVLRNIDQYN